ANFYRRFIEGYSRIARHLNGLLAGGTQGKFSKPFTLTPQAEASFEALKTAFTTAPVLQHFDPSQRLRLETDASKYAIAGILSQPRRGAAPDSTDQHWHPVAYWSRKTVPAERNYYAGDAEMLAIVMACKHWRHYIEGARHRVTVLTDHANLTGFFTTHTLTGRRARWWERLAGLDLEIVYRQGKLNPADAPSRRPGYELDAEDDIPPPTPMGQPATGALTRPAYRSRQDRNSGSQPHSGPDRSTLGGAAVPTLQSGHPTEGGAFMAPQVAAVIQTSRRGGAATAPGPTRAGEFRTSGHWPQALRSPGSHQADRRREAAGTVRAPFEIAGIGLQRRILPEGVWLHALATEGAYNARPGS
ncbi:MAG: Ty3/Gypsy family RNase HI domain-containing protein, partial [Angustibacter sp.]